MCQFDRVVSVPFRCPATITVADLSRWRNIQTHTTTATRQRRPKYTPKNKSKWKNNEMLLFTTGGRKTLVECMTHNQSSCCCYSDTFALGIHNTTTAAADARTLSHSLLLLFLLLRSTTWKQVQHRQKHTAEVALPLRRGEKKRHRRC